METLSNTNLTYTYGGDNANCTVSTCPIFLSVYGYRPSVPFSAALIALYALCIAVQLYLGIRYKKWGFMAAMVLGCQSEIIGYVGRILYYQNPWAQSGFIIQIGELFGIHVQRRSLTVIVLITISPVFFSAAIYVMLSQIVVYISQAHSRVNPRLYWIIFITCDVIALILQAVGGAMSSTSNGSSDAGVNIALAGLSFQVATLVFFSATVIDYMFRSRSVWGKVKLPRSFIIFCTFLALATVLILIRCCYRVYELSEGYSRDSEGLRDEPMFIALEGVSVPCPPAT